MIFIDFQLMFVAVFMFKFRQRTHRSSSRTRLRDCVCGPMSAVLLLALISVVVCQAQSTDESGKTSRSRTISKQTQHYGLAK